jgi:peptidoglycan/xylan/chitin deacetylase (PgdA/CDA1 family)
MKKHLYAKETMSCQNSVQNIFTALFINFVFIGNVLAQIDKPWNNKECAVVLTYDDGLNVDLTNVIPALDSLELKGTFYISDYFDGLKDQIFKWRKAASEGHELANHTIWHPCEGGREGREFVTPEHDLNTYTVSRMVSEIRAMNNILKAIDGKRKRTFAYPCGDTKIHDTAYLDGLKDDFVAARGVMPEMLPINKINLYNIGCYAINGETGDQLIALVKQAMTTHTLLVFLFHGVGGEHSLNVSLPAHSQLLHFLKQHERNIWMAPMIDVADYIKNHQQKKIMHNHE